MKRTKNQKKKGQLIAYDFIGGFTIFIIIIILGTLFWFRTSSQSENQIILKENFIKARQVSYLLAKTPGYPERWEGNVTESCFTYNCNIGLAHSPNVVSSLKLAAFLNISDDNRSEDYGYNRVKELFGISEFEYYVTIREPNRAISNATGKDPNENISAVVRRNIIIDGEIKNLEVSVYKSTE